MTREPPPGDGSVLVRCLTAAHLDLAAIDTLPVDDDDGRQELLASAAGWWWQAATLAHAAGDHDQARILEARGRVLTLRASHEWDADDEAWMLDELDRLLDFEEAVGTAMDSPSGPGAIIDVVGALSGLHTARREDDDDDRDAAAPAVGA
jgi:hypothetical protein